MLASAVTVSVGALPPRGVAAANRFPQMEWSPAVPPAELTHAAMMLASVFNFVVGKVAPAGSAGPGAGGGVR